MTSTRLPVMGPDGKPQYLIIVLHDLTERKRDEARIAYMAHHDPLTELPNRAAFNQCLEAVVDLVRVVRRELWPFDHRSSTDSNPSTTRLALTPATPCSKQLAERLQEACEGAFLARIGGDELAVISPTGPQPATAEKLARRLSAAVMPEFDVEGHPVSAGVTIGIAIAPGDGHDTTTLLANAEAALYRAKAEARGSIRFFEIADGSATARKARIAARSARRDRKGRARALLPAAGRDGRRRSSASRRWRAGTIRAAAWSRRRHFIPLAEESGLILSLGDWILRTACREAASWPKPLRIAVNMSPVQFQHGDLRQSGASGSARDRPVAEPA